MLTWHDVPIGLPNLFISSRKYHRQSSQVLFLGQTEECNFMKLTFQKFWIRFEARGACYIQQNVWAFGSMIRCWILNAA